MQRENRLAVFEHVPHKERTSPTKNGSKVLKRPRSPDPSYEENTQRNTKRRRQYLKSSELQVKLNCEYDECDYSTTKYYDFLKHLEQHAVKDEYQSDEKDCICLWENCQYSCTNVSSLKQHIAYHGYHTKLKNIGNTLLARMKLPDCTPTDSASFQLPDLPNKYMCEWDSCAIQFLNYQIFVDHVKCHVNALPKKCNDHNSIKCEWPGCSSSYSTQCKLLEHTKCHTKEKVVACPTCEVMFSCNTKFYDHRKRQLSTDLQGYQCSQCTKLFASERLLRDHMRIHINHYKCHLCDMTCPKPSSLAKHIRYRHLPERLFKCDICNHSTITQQDLTFHKETHINVNKMQCRYCDYQCRSKYAINKHLKQVHEGRWEYKYACHCCDKRFARGGLLTKHLINVHDFHWPSGHSRFSYKQDAKTGLYHLQVVRYESLEVTQEMMQGNIPYQLQNGQNWKFECEQSDKKPLAFVLKLSEKASSETTNSSSFVLDDIKTENTNEKKKPINEDDVIITVEEVDNKGNVVKLEMIETSKIIYTSKVQRNKKNAK